MTVCKYCKNENPEGVTFCKNCGNTLEKELPKSAPSKDPSVISASASASAPVIPMPVPVEKPYTEEPSYPGTPTPPQTPGQIPYVAAEGPNSRRAETPNTIPFNDKDRKEYEEKLRNPYKTDLENTCVLALIFGFISLVFNPLCVISLVAITLGIIGHVNNGSKKSMAKLGWILGVISLAIQLIFFMAIGFLFLGVISFLRYLF
ncbi:MAG: hypothetical protein J6040_03065 [Clostridiales bacterium]|nr:hypothetical protein [Clostridiales bacterium]